MEKFFFYQERNVCLWMFGDEIALYDADINLNFEK